MWYLILTVVYIAGGVSVTHLPMESQYSCNVAMTAITAKESTRLKFTQICVKQ